MAIANSYPLGRFIGNSKMRDFLPEAFSDYIFAIIFEEGGPLMALFVLLLYLILFVRCYVLSRRTESPYIRLIMLGLPLIIVIQALIHIGVCTGAMFVTGQPLPLISRGGSSIIGTSISFGILLALSRIIRQEQLERAELAAENTESLQDNPIPNENEISD
jgi:cell division protein FtsW